MMKRHFVHVLMMLLTWIFVSGELKAQTQAEGEKSWALSFIENKLSTPNRKIRLSNLEGTLASQASIDEITIADRQGIWVRITKAEIDWNRSALLLGRFSVNRLNAQRIEILRQPQPDPESLPDPQAQLFSMPQLPVAVEIASLSSPLIVLGENLFDRATKLSLTGQLNLANGNLDAQLHLHDLEQGGYFALIATYAQDREHLTLDVDLNEPENGILANLLELEGRPPVTMSIKGAGKVSDLDIDLTLSSDEASWIAGQLQLRQLENSKNFHFAAGGSLQNILPVLYRPFFGVQTNLDIGGILQNDGGIRLEKFNLTSGKNFHLSAAGILENWQFDGEIKLIADDLNGFSQRFGSTIGGKGEFEAKGQIGLLDSAFDLDLVGIAPHIRFNHPTIARLFTTETALRGQIKRDGHGLHFDTLTLHNDAFQLNLQGSFSNHEADLDAKLDLSDLALFDPLIEGKMQIRASARGHNGVITLAARGETEEGRLSNRSLQGPVFELNGLVDNRRSHSRRLFAQLTGSGQLDGQDLSLKTDFRLSDEERRFDQFELTLGTARITGAFDYLPDDLLAGDLNFTIEDLSSLAALTALDGSGAVQGDIHFTSHNGEQGVDGRMEASNLQLAYLHLERLVLTSQVKEGSAHIGIEAQTYSHDQLAMMAILTPHSLGNWDLILQQAQLGQGMIDAQLVEPTHITLSDHGQITIGTTRLNVATGTVILAGEVGETLALEAQFTQMPLTLINLFQPQLAAQGMLGGSLQLHGSRNAPQLDFNLEADGIKAAPLQQNGIADLTVKAQGKSDGKRVEVQVSLGNAEGSNNEETEVTAAGQIDLSLQELDLEVVLIKGKLATFSEAFKSPGLTGQLIGSGHIGGQFTDLQAQFELAAVQVSSSLLVENGLSPLDAKIRLRFGDHTFILDSFHAEGPSGLNFTATGQVPLSGQGVEAQAQGSVPMALANRFLSARGGQLSGLLALEIKATGSMQNPQFGGQFNIQDGQFIDPPSNSHLKDITISGHLIGDQINVTQIQAVSARGGKLQGHGTISTNLAQGLPTTLNVTLDHVRYNDGKMVAAMIDGEISLIGPLLRDFELGGKILLETVEISIPNLASSSKEIELQHKNLKPAIATTLARAQREPQRRDRAPGLIRSPLPPRFNLEISAPARIFIRGRGLDSELGGALRLTGPLTEPRGEGSLNLIRGRVDILTKRLELEEGRITLFGAFDPELYFFARSQGNGLDVHVTLSGRLDDVSINFASQPELPQDEVLAFLIFGRSLGELSPLQIAQLATSMAELTGLSGPSLLNRLRAATGFDDLDLTTDSQGNTAIKAGRYLRDNIYLGVEADNHGETRGSINLDITKDLKAKGTIDSNSNSSVGIFYEKDY